MTRLISYFKILPALAATWLMAGGCSSDSLPQADAGALTEISLSIVFTGDGRSRADEGKWEVIDRPHDADIFETRIAPATVRIVVYKGDDSGNFSHFETISGPRIRKLTFIGSDTYRLVAAFSEQLAVPEGGTPVKVMIYANDDNEPGQAMPLPAELKAIPMWGVATARIMPDLTHQNIGDINMLRAYAKIKLSLDESLSDHYEITAAAVDGINHAGYTRPRHYNEVEATTDLMYKPAGSPLYCFNPVEPAEQGAGINLHKAAGDGITPHLYAYTPETVNDPDDPVTLVIDILDTSTGMTQQFTVTKNSDGTPLDNLVRNHIYSYTITSVSFTDGLRFKAVIEDMEKGGEYDYEY